MPNNLKYQLQLTLFLPLLLSCSASLEDYQDNTPAFNLKHYFSGNITAYGIIQDYTTKLTRHFCVDIIGHWQGNTGQLHETFYFNDGEQQLRVWKLKISENGKVTGTADDVVGEASGRAIGNAFNWKYDLRVPIDESSYTFAIDDWLFALDKNRVMNRSYMRKIGVTVAEISIFFDKNLAACNTSPST